MAPPAGFDYSKWDKLELSDDEDLHPGAQFIEANTLRRIKRESQQNKASDIDAKIEEYEKSIKETKKRIKTLEIDIVEDRFAVDEDALKSVRDELENLETTLRETQEKLEAEKKKRTFSAEELCKVTTSKTLVGKDCMPTEVSENVQAQKMTYEAYCEKYEKELDTLAEGGDIETKSQNKNPYARIEAYLSKHTYLVCEHALGYLLLKALYEEMDGVVGRDKVLSTAKAGFALKSISDFATANKRTMLDQYKPFFVRLLENDEKVLHEYELAEMDYVEKLIERAEKKKMEEEAEAKKVEGTTQTGVEEIENPPLGPGGLNPIEVFESLPEEMQTAFESGDVEALREYVNGLSMKDAKFYMRRMVDSGLWVPQEGEHPGTALVDSGDDEEEKEKVRDDDDETKAT